MSNRTRPGARVVFGDLNEHTSEALADGVGDPARLRYVLAESHVAALVETATDAFAESGAVTRHVN